MDVELGLRQISRRRLLQLMGAGGLALSAGGLLEACASATQSSNTKIKKGGILTVAQGADMTTLDPHVSNLVPEWVILYSVYETLGYFDSATQQVQPQLAKKWAWQDGNTSLVFTLQDGVTFHNGDPLTADDVVASYNRELDPKTGATWASLLVDIKGIEVVDPKTVRFKTANLSNALLAAVPYVPIVPKSAIATIAKVPIGTGPFKWGEWKLGDHVRIDKNPNYWRPGLPYLDQIIFKPIEQEDTRLAALAGGQVDVVYNVALKNVATIKANSKLQVSILPPSDQPYDGYFNTRKPPFNNLQVRQAFLYAIDRKSFVDRLLAGNGQVAYSPLAQGTWAYNPALTGKYDYDLTKAADLLKQAGYPGGAGLKFSLIVPNGFLELSQLSQLVQSAFTTLGAQVTVNQMDIAVWGADLTYPYNFDASFDTDVNHAADPSVMFAQTYLWHPDGNNNLSGFTDAMAPDFSSTLDQANQTADRATRIGLYRKAQEEFMDLALSPVVCFKSIAHGLQATVQGFQPAPQFHQDWSTTWLNR